MSDTFKVSDTFLMIEPIVRAGPDLSRWMPGGRSPAATNQIRSVPANLIDGNALTDDG